MHGQQNIKNRRVRQATVEKYHVAIINLSTNSLF